jgi:hypothetical protein
MAIQLANIVRRFWRHNDKLRPCNGLFPMPVRHKRPARWIGRRRRRKIAHNQIKIEVKRLRSSKEYTIYISVCRKATPSAATYA